jgi:hypothetical protein
MTPPAFDFAAKVAEGYVFTPPGIEWNVITPAGRHGAGPTPEDAILNVDSQILTRDRKRVLVRADGSEIVLDKGTLAEEENPEPVPAKTKRAK